ncbi:MAG: PAS domain-containing protein [Bacteroidales bacterium]|nr:PAS domain-containing protein [Bacteroidales bacterium]
MTQKIDHSMYKNDSGFMSAVSDSLSLAMCVVNSNLEVVHFNHRFAELFGLRNREISGKRFGLTIGCKGHQNNIHEGICSNCKLRLSMQAAIMNRQNQPRESIVIEVGDDAEEGVRLIQYESNFMEYKGNSFAVVLLADLTNMGKETLDFINNFYANT